ncbi:MAG: hypothetical protein HOL08_09260 [Opitutae bacterium]|nr:hypothetical protein [Opitutae bacterium]
MSTAVPTKAVGTAGADDNFAGSFLYGMTDVMSFPESADLANKTATSFQRLAINDYLRLSAGIIYNEAMPLPHVKLFCRSIKRATGGPCKNPAAWGCRTCRYHGARRPQTVKRGQEHWAYKDGSCSTETRDTYRQAAAELRKIEEIGFKHGVLVGKRTPGRKPKE